jgi:undecaprenyl-diphosphatase
MNAFEEKLFNLINAQWHTPFLDHFLPAIASTDIWTPILISVALGAFVLGGRKGRLVVLCAAVGLLLGDAIVSHTLKHAIGRVRPRDAMEGVFVRGLSPNKPRILHVFDPPVVRVTRGKSIAHGQSFPSSHTLNLFMLATVAWCFKRKVGVVVGFMACLVAYSRVYSGAHWPSDIPPSALLGILVGWLSIKIVKQIALRFKWMPMDKSGALRASFCEPA